jgi:hypothetical protein
MSANLGLVSSIFASWERGDFSSADWAEAEIEFSSPMGVESGPSRGLEEMAHAWRATMSAWRDARANAEEYRQLDAERVLVLYSFNGRGRLSGVNVTPSWTRGAALFHLRDGKVSALPHLCRPRACARRPRSRFLVRC